MKTRTLLLLTIGWLAYAVGPNNTAAAENPGHEELRALRKEVIDAITKGDFDGVIKRVHTNVVVTWQNGEVCRGHQGLREFFNRMGKNSFKGYKVPPTPDELTIFHGEDTGVSFGETVANYYLLGKDLELKSRWTATLVKENGQWLLASYHISMNVLDNPLLNAAKQGLYAVGGVALLGGAILGAFLGRRKKG